MNETKPSVLSPSYQFFILVLSLYAVIVLAVEAAVSLDPEIRAIVDYADYAVCAVFLSDFVLSLWRAPNRMHYFFTWGWLDLLSSIPTLDAVRWGRIARVVRVLRVLRGLRATKILTAVVLRRRAENTFLAASLVAILLLIFCSVAVLQFERSPESNIKTADDAIWWAFATITTVGYGDRYPVTPEGRFVAAILMCAGVGLFSIFSGFLAAWFVAPGGEGAEPNATAELGDKIDALRKELAELRRTVEGTRIPA